MTKMISLLAAAYVAGLLRHPDEGALPATDDEARRLIDEGKAIDVTADFGDVASDVAPPVDDDPVEAAEPEQANPPEPPAHAGDDHKPARRKASASKE